MWTKRCRARNEPRTSRYATMTPVRDEVLISVDIETSGQSPSVGSLLSIGACLVTDPSVGLYLELKPIADRAWSDEAAGVHGLARDRLEREGLDPAEAMTRLAAWIEQQAGGGWPIFVGFNAPFDWMFVTDYFWRHLGRNPFGVSALDLKSLYMGRVGAERWELTRRVHVDARLGLAADHSHNALEDAQGQARLAQVLLNRDGFEPYP
jgi:DNA polymerase III epsilon subunit-like protein